MVQSATNTQLPRSTIHISLWDMNKAFDKREKVQTFPGLPTEGANDRDTERDLLRQVEVQAMQGCQDRPVCLACTIDVLLGTICKERVDSNNKQRFGSRGSKPNRLQSLKPEPNRTEPRNR